MWADTFNSHNYIRHLQSTKGDDTGKGLSSQKKKDSQRSQCFPFSPVTYIESQRGKYTEDILTKITRLELFQSSGRIVEWIEARGGLYRIIRTMRTCLVKLGNLAWDNVQNKWDINVMM